jgi:hypothetical protein
MLTDTNPKRFTEDLLTQTWDQTRNRTPRRSGTKDAFVRKPINPLRLGDTSLGDRRAAAGAVSCGHLLLYAERPLVNQIVTGRHLIQEWRRRRWRRAAGRSSYRGGQRNLARAGRHNGVTPSGSAGHTKDLCPLSVILNGPHAAWAVKDLCLPTRDSRLPTWDPSRLGSRRTRIYNDIANHSDDIPTARPPVECSTWRTRAT